MVLFHIHHKELATLQDTTAPLGTFWRVLTFVLVFLEDTGVDNSHIAGVNILFYSALLQIRTQTSVAVYLYINLIVLLSANSSLSVCECCFFKRKLQLFHIEVVETPFVPATRNKYTWS